MSRKVLGRALLQFMLLEVMAIRKRLWQSILKNHGEKSQSGLCMKRRNELSLAEDGDEK